MVRGGGYARAAAAGSVTFPLRSTCLLSSPLHLSAIFRYVLGLSRVLVKHTLSDSMPPRVKRAARKTSSAADAADEITASRNATEAPLRDADDDSYADALTTAPPPMEEVKPKRAKRVRPAAFSRPSTPSAQLSETEDDGHDDDVLAPGELHAEEDDGKTLRQTTTTRVVGLPYFYSGLCKDLKLPEGTDLYAWTNRSEKCRDRMTQLLSSKRYFGDCKVAKPRDSPVRLHAAYFEQDVVIALVGDHGAEPSPLKGDYEKAFYASLSKDKETGLRLPVKDRLRLVLGAEHWPEHYVSLLRLLDWYITDWVACQKARELYTDTKPKLRTPSPEQLRAKWTPDSVKGEAPMRHFFGTFPARDEDGKDTGKDVMSLDFSVKYRNVPATVDVWVADEQEEGGGLFNYGTRPHEIEQGARIYPALAFRGLNLLPTQERIGPNVQAVRLFMAEKTAKADAEMDFGALL